MNSTVFKVAATLVSHESLSHKRTFFILIYLESVGRFSSSSGNVSNSSNMVITIDLLPLSMVTFPLGMRIFSQRSVSSVYCPTKCN